MRERPSAVRAQRQTKTQYLYCQSKSTPIPIVPSSLRRDQFFLNLQSSVPLTAGPVTPVMQVIDDLINASDAAMYQAKRAGGNQVCHSQVAPPLD